MQKERFTKREFDYSRALLRSFVSEFHFGLFEALEKIEDLRCIVEEDEDTGDVFYCFIEGYGRYVQRVSCREMSLSAVEAFIFEAFKWSLVNSSFRENVALSFSYYGYSNALTLSMPDFVDLLLSYFKRDFNAFQSFDFHPFSKISLISFGKDDSLTFYSDEEFEEIHPVLYYYLRKNGLL